MKVLFVEDNETSVKGIMDYCDEKGWDNSITGFEDCYKEIMVSNPDVVVLDWCADPGDDAGLSILECIWTNGYRPIIIFTGNIETINLQEEYKKSGLVNIISKGDETPVINCLNDLKETCSAMSSFRKELGNSLVEAFRAIEPIQRASGGYIGEEILKYLLAKRAVNYFDLEKIDIPLPAWSMYQYPPVISTFLTTCDVLRRVNQETNFAEVGEPSDYVVILTPSCDMVMSGTRTPKVERVLYAECKKISDSALGGKTSEKRIKDILKSGLKEHELPLPALKNVLPNMIVDMKHLRTADINEIAIDQLAYSKDKDKYKYIRICSIDSPFREQIVWIYVKNAGRTGVPDRDFEAWARAIVS